ncbi:MAG: hypothetical protein JXA07_11160 [Spirochaetes bacterium]|nr:hypothetical protein [Spirochaetota bacterium]
MSFCETCPIEEKLMQCCGRLPMTGERARLVLASGVEVYACPNLGADGRCTIYENRPIGCREFFCDAFMTEEKALVR